MKKILVSLLAIAMLFAFTACNNENGEPAAQITNADELAAFAAQTGDFEGKTNAKLSGTITLESTVSFTKSGLTLGAEDGAKIVAGETGGTESEPVTLLSIDADKITFNDVVIEATGTQCTYAVAVNANDFGYLTTDVYENTNPFPPLLPVRLAAARAGTRQSRHPEILLEESSRPHARRVVWQSAGTRLV